MAKISLAQRFCTKCGAAVDISQSSCTVCGTEMNARYKQSMSQNTDALTVKVAHGDPDVTIRGASPLLSHVYRKAVQQEADSQATARIATQVSQAHKHLLTSKHIKQYLRKSLLLKIACATGLLLVLLLAGGAALDHGTSARTQQQANQNKAQLDHLIQQAQADGIPSVYLQSILKQEQLTNLYTPLTVFPNPLAAHIHQNLATQYYTLYQQAQSIITATTQQLQEQAQRDMQNFQTELSIVNTQSIGDNRNFSQAFSQEQIQLASAHSASDYIHISENARNSIDGLLALKSTSTQLNDFHTTLETIKQAHLDVSAMQTQYQDDLNSFNAATRANDFQNLSTQLNAQYQQLVVNSVQDFPYVSVTKLNQLTAQINDLKTYGLDPGAYQKRLDADQVTKEHAKTVNDDLVFFTQIDGDIALMQNDLVHGQAHYLVRQFHQEVDTWAKEHPYHDTYDGHDYALDNGYMSTGIGKAIDDDLSSAQTLADFSTVSAETNNALFNLHMFAADFQDHTPYTQVHNTDVQMMKYYHLQHKQVLMVSLVEQAMRIYQDGDMLQSYQITTGRQELPSPPGVWSVLDRKSPIIFTAGVPQSSPYWFPPTPINYAILYHYGGDFVHDSPWRGNYGPGTQFPHQDPSGTTVYNFDGSHGCINLSESAAAWVYQHTGWDTVVVVY